MTAPVIRFRSGEDELPAVCCLSCRDTAPVELGYARPFRFYRYALSCGACDVQLAEWELGDEESI